MGQSTYIPHPTDLSEVKMTPVVRAFTKDLAHFMYENKTKAALGGFFTPPTWEELSDEVADTYISNAESWAKFLECRFGLDSIFGGDYIRPESIRESIAREQHERVAAQLLKERPDRKVVPYDELSYLTQIEYERVAGEVCACIEEFSEVYARGVETVDEFLQGTGKRYNIAFGIGVESLEKVRLELEKRIGWKSTNRHYDFQGVSGFYISTSENSWNLYHGNQLCARFYPSADGGLGGNVYTDAFRQYEDLHPMTLINDLLTGAYCLDEHNVALLREETHYGHEVIYGVRYGESAAFCIPKDNAGREDISLLKALSEREHNIRIVGADLFAKSIDDWCSQTVRQGFEPPQVPVMIRYAFDGETLRSEREISLETKRTVSPEIASDWLLIDALRDGGAAIRQEFQQECGIESSRLFRFKDAYFPTPLIVDDALFVCRDCGNDYDGFLTAVNGKVCFYPADQITGGEIKGYGTPSQEFKSVDEALGYVRSVVLSKENIMRGRAEYALFKKSNDRSIGV